MEDGLSGRRVIVTGGSRGIGAASAQAFAEAGAHVAIVARSASNLDQSRARILEATGQEPVVTAADLSTAEGVERSMAYCIEHLGGVDVLVNNAGASDFGTVETVTDEQWRQGLDLKLMGYIRCMRAVLPRMRSQRWGRVINLGGIGGMRAIPEYSMGLINTAVDHLTKTTASLVGQDGVSVTCIHPGLITTDRSKQYHSAGVPVSPSPLAREGTAEEVAALVVYLASNAAGYITGTSIVIDGGAMLGVINPDTPR